MAEDINKTGVDPEEEEKDQQTEGGEDTTDPQSDSQDEGGESDDGEESEEEKEDDDSEPPTRRPNSYWVGFRKGKKANRQADNQKSDKSGDDEGGDDDANVDNMDPDDEELDPQDRKLLERELAKALDPITKKLADKEDEATLQGYLSENPEFKSYEKKIRRYMAHPSRQHLPVDTVALEVVGAKNLMKLGAQKGKQADKRASKTRSAGSSPRSSEKADNVWGESKDDFEKRQNEVRSKLADR